MEICSEENCCIRNTDLRTEAEEILATRVPNLLRVECVLA
jgi:hypothetical protein